MPTQATYLVHSVVPTVLLRQRAGVRNGRIELLVQHQSADLEHVALRLLVRLQIRRLRERTDDGMESVPTPRPHKCGVACLMQNMSVRILQGFTMSTGSGGTANPTQEGIMELR